MNRVMTLFGFLLLATLSSACGENRTADVDKTDGELHYYACLRQRDGYREMVLNKTSQEGCYKLILQDKAAGPSGEINGWWISWGFAATSGCGSNTDTSAAFRTVRSDAELEMNDEETLLSGYLAVLFKEGWAATFEMTDVEITSCD